ncbi:hypothetical protein LCGC14_0196440 [marine sediment metagenome]|uniref:Uncharacterized protein n=1 Tax=marine sediment metagenome TaxID=412755 RepID=A0A0F9X4R3_9ZZZZ
MIRRIIEIIINWFIKPIPHADVIVTGINSKGEQIIDFESLLYPSR